LIVRGLNLNKKVNVSLTAEMHTKAKIICVLKGITLNEYIAKALEKEIGKDKSILEKLDKE
jgi:predicted HicB family RNase H-like nuclease